MKRFQSIVGLVVLLLLSGCGMRMQSGTVFNADLVLSVRYEGGGAKAAYAEMQREAERLERLYSRVNPDSVIAAFNAAPAGTSMEIDGELYTILRDAERLFADTFGMFDISLGGINALFMTDIAGLGGDKPAALPDADGVRAARAVSGLGGGHYTLTDHGTGGTLQKHSDGFTLDLNGYLKGYAASRMADIAAERGAKNCIVNLGGDIATVSSETVFSIGIRNPDDRQSYLCVFDKPSGTALATSGGYERFYQFEYAESSVRLCHISDGRSGMPAGVGYDGATGRYYDLPARIESATVLGGRAADCEAYATALCVAGADELVPLMTALRDEGYEAVAFSADGRMYTTGAFSFSTAYTAYTAFERVEV